MTILRKIAENINTSKHFQGILSFDEPMNALTTFKVGGHADVFVAPADEKSLLFVLNSLIAENVPFFILGGGSNIVVSDDGIEGFVISTTALTAIKVTDKNGNDLNNKLDNQNELLLYCGAGCTFEQITDFCIQNELTGLENFAGLPGTVGGAAYMNARCYENSMSDALHEVCYISSVRFDAICLYAVDKSEWDYKKSPFQELAKKESTVETEQSDQSDQSNLAGAVILAATFRVQKGDCGDITEKSMYYIEDRKKKGHFWYPSAGSVFKNNRAFGKPSGKIIDEAGLCGFRVGNAQIATWHGNFMVNLGDASADDIKELVAHVQIQVKKKTGFDLECEILFCGKTH